MPWAAAVLVPYSRADILRSFPGWDFPACSDSLLPRAEQRIGRGENLQERGFEARPACNVAEPGASGSGKPRLLIVEDESLISRYLADLLGQLGYGVSACVASGHAALEAAARDRPDLAIVDIGLAGGMDGISTACLLRQRFDTPSIFLSGASDAALLARASGKVAGLHPQAVHAGRDRARGQGRVRRSLERYR